MDSFQEPGWGLFSGLTVALSSYISQELELSGSLPIRNASTTANRKKFKNTRLPIDLIYKSTPTWGKIWLTLSWAMIYGNNGVLELFILNHHATSRVIAGADPANTGHVVANI